MSTEGVACMYTMQQMTRLSSASHDLGNYVWVAMPCFKGAAVACICVMACNQVFLVAALGWVLSRYSV